MRRCRGQAPCPSTMPISRPRRARSLATSANEGLRILRQTVFHHALPRGVPFARTHSHPASMIVVTEAEVAASRAPFDRGGELAAMELRGFPPTPRCASLRPCHRRLEAFAAASLRLPSSKRR